MHVFANGVLQNVDYLYDKKPVKEMFAHFTGKGVPCPVN